MRRSDKEKEGRHVIGGDMRDYGINGEMVMVKDVLRPKIRVVNPTCVGKKRRCNNSLERMTIVRSRALGFVGPLKINFICVLREEALDKVKQF